MYIVYVLVMCAGLNYAQASQQNIPKRSSGVVGLLQPRIMPTLEEIKLFFDNLGSTPFQQYRGFHSPVSDHSLVFALLRKYGKSIQDIENPDEYGFATLTAAAVSDKWTAEEFERLLEMKAINLGPNKHGDTSLNIAVANRDFKKAKLLIQNGSDINHIGDDGFTPLAYAAFGDSPALVTMLLFAGADPQIKVTSGAYRGKNLYDIAQEYPRVMAAIKKYEQNKDASLKEKESIAEEYSRDDERRTKLNVAMLQQDNVTAKEILLKNKDLLNENDLHGWTLLKNAVVGVNVPLVEFIIKQGADIDKTDKFHETVLMVAARNGRKNIIKILLKAGANPYITNSENKNSVDILKELYPAILQDAEIQTELAKWAAIKKITAQAAEEAAKLGKQRQQKKIKQAVLAGSSLDSDTAGIITGYLDDNA